MDNTTRSNKTNSRIDYEHCKNICYICKKIGKQKSKQFDTLYALKYHLTTAHNREDEIKAEITRKQILRTIRSISKALEWKMLSDISKEK